MEEIYTVYVLFSKKHEKIYIGYTSDLIQRFYSHNSKGKKGYTIKYRPWEVVYCEYYRTKSEAMEREKQIKSSRGRVFIWEEVKRNYK